LFNNCLRKIGRAESRGVSVDDRRRAPRYGVELEGIIRSGLWGDDKVAISSLSIDGCRFASARRRISAGTALTMALGPVGVIHASIAWRVGPIHGVRFDQALHPAVLDHIRLFLSNEPALIEEERPAA
jgi:hypothetical protein